MRTRGISPLCQRAAKNFYTIVRIRSHGRIYGAFSNHVTICSVDEDEIELQTSALRQKLTSSSSSNPKSDRKGQFKPHQVHELAQAKIEESEKLRKALGISANYEEGSHWKKQEERLRDGLGEKELGR